MAGGVVVRLLAPVLTTLAIEGGRALIHVGAQRLGARATMLAPRPVDPIAKAKWDRANRILEEIRRRRDG